jgi:hypothetical protein
MMTSLRLRLTRLSMDRVLRLVAAASHSELSRPGPGEPEYACLRPNQTPPTRRRVGPGDDHRGFESSNDPGFESSESNQRVTRTVLA